MCRTSGHPRRPVLDALQPTATMRLEEYAFPFENETLDVIWSTSLFTHLLPNAGTTTLARCAAFSRPATSCGTRTFFATRYRSRSLASLRREGIVPPRNGRRALRARTIQRRGAAMKVVFSNRP